MRYVLGFLCLCALGAMPLVGCSSSDECQSSEDCNDRNACTDEVCETSGICIYRRVSDGIECDFDGVPGACVNGVCGEDICRDVVCDDGNECTGDICSFVDGCYFPNQSDGRPCDWNGENGVCTEGVCGQDPCEVLDCDDGDLCTDDWCQFGECSHSTRCYDGNECTEDCDPETGACNHTPVRNGTRCCADPVFVFCFGWGNCQDGRCI